MRLAIAHPFLHVKGGAEKVVLKIAQKFDATVFCTDYDQHKTYPEFSSLDIRVLPRGHMTKLFALFPKRAREAAIAGQQFWNWKAPDEFDVVNAQGTPSEWVRHRNSPVAWFCHSPNREAFVLYEWRQRQRNIAERAVYRSFVHMYKHFEFATVPKIEHIFANSETTRERIAKYLHRKDAEVLHPGVDCREFECKGYEKFFFYPSRIVPEKRFELAIEAFEKFRKARKAAGGKARNERWKLVLAGALHHGIPHHVDYYNKLAELASRDPDVEILLDLQSNKIRDLYARCYSVLYTPIHEDFGIVPLEGFASCKPVLAWNEGGPREIVEEGKNGYLVNNTNELAAKMAYLADRPKLAEQMGKAGRARAERDFSWERFLTRFGAACEKLSASR
ncbi:Trehalose synthase [Candidatus Burarchaeum australiense]|nr:Trehalose synthase [Candidatus Burarchaeum australiense]